MTDTLTDAPERVDVASARHDALEPEAFLRAQANRPRGFWSHGAAWSAFAGEAGVVVPPPGDDRFAATCRRVRALGPSIDSSAPDGESPWRMYGGFGFDGTEPADPRWRAFGPGRFVLPAIEARHDDRLGCHVHARARAAEGGVEAARRMLDHVRRATPRAGAASAPPGRIVTTPDRRAWDAAVARALEAIDGGAIDKVVLARTLEVAVRSAVDPVDLLARLRRDNPRSTVFYFEPVPGTAFLGAAPEVVVSLHGRRFETTAVAGSVARGRDAGEDAAQADSLMASAKERREHAFGVDDLRRRVAPFAEAIDADPEPHVLRLARIQHLETHIRARIGSGHHVLDLLGALHPTAAVCGVERGAAAEYLARTEPFERGWYAGPVGWFDATGDGVFAPALRSGVGCDGRWRLYAGAGIVAGSDAAREWDETGLKFQPMLRALGAASGA